MKIRPLTLPLVLLLASCAGSAGSAAQAPTAEQGVTVAPNDDPFGGTAPPEQREQPPPSGLAPEWHFPTVHARQLDNGLSLRVAERHNLPLVEIQLVALSGTATDGDHPGLAIVAGELMKAGGAGPWNGRQLLERAESLGASLEVLTDRDSTRISMAVTREHFDTALEIIGAVALKPRFDYGEFVKLKRREMDRVASLARTSAGWAASMVLYRELFELPTAQHPYARYDATSEEFDKIQLADCRTWHRDHLTPPNTVLVVTGDLTADDAEQAARKVFGGWKGNAPARPSFTRPMPPSGLELFLVDRPDSPQAEVYVATLGTDRQSPEWATLRTANQILGGGVAGRLFLDVREKRSLAYRTHSTLESVANGPVPIILSAGTQTAKAGLALGALLEHFGRMGTEPVANEEVEIATRYLSDVFLLSVDTVGAIANLTTQLSVFNLPEGYYDRYRADVREVTATQVSALTAQFFKPKDALVVVAGDAERLGKPLSHFGTVSVIDPDKGFIKKATVDHDPTAAVELERLDGT